MGEDSKVNKTKPNIFKKEIKLGWFFKFLLISGSIFVIVLLIGIVLINISDNENENIRLQKELNELSKKIELQTRSSQVEQKPTTLQPVVVQDSDPIIDCVSVKCGNRRVRKSVCDVSICCELDNEWAWANSETECVNAQNYLYEIERAREEKESKESKETAEEYVWSVECSTDAFVSYNSCMDVCLEVIGEDAKLGDECMSSCKKDYDFARGECN